MELPEPFVVTAAVSKVVAADPYPLLPAAYSCTVAPLTGCEPAITLPLKLTPVPPLVPLPPLPPLFAGAVLLPQPQANNKSALPTKRESRERAVEKEKKRFTELA